MSLFSFSGEQLNWCPTTFGPSPIVCVCKADSYSATVSIFAYARTRLYDHKKCQRALRRKFRSLPGFTLSQLVASVHCWWQNLSSKLSSSPSSVTFGFNSNYGAQRQIVRMLCECEGACWPIWWKVWMFKYILQPKAEMCRKCIVSKNVVLCVVWMCSVDCTFTQQSSLRCLLHCWWLMVVLMVMVFVAVLFARCFFADFRLTKRSTQ